MTIIKGGDASHMIVNLQGHRAIVLQWRVVTLAQVLRMLLIVEL